MAKFKHIIFDFDCTITKKHLHNECFLLIKNSSVNVQYPHDGQILSNEENNELWQALVNQNCLESAGEPSKWRAIFDGLLNHGYLISIASFNAFPGIIKKYLEEIIGINTASIMIESWLPESIKDKNQHIENVVSKQNMRKVLKDDFLEVLLIDDSEPNVKAFDQLVGAQQSILVLRSSEFNADIVKSKLENMLEIHIENVSMNTKSFGQSQ